MHLVRPEEFSSCAQETAATEDAACPHALHRCTLTLRNTTSAAYAGIEVPIMPWPEPLLRVSASG
jgi:hypothetical protein